MATVEQRIQVLETEVAMLKQQLRNSDSANWLNRIAGSLRDAPEFDEVLRLGQYIRKQDSSDDVTDGMER